MTSIQTKNFTDFVDITGKLVPDALTDVTSKVIRELFWSFHLVCPGSHEKVL